MACGSMRWCDVAAIEGKVDRSCAVESGVPQCAAEKAGTAASLNNYRSERNPISLNFLPPVPIHSFTAEGINPAFVIELPTKEKE